MRVIIPGEPVAQGRGRAFGFKRGDGSIGVRVFDPGKSRNWKAAAQAHMAAAMNESPPLSEPVFVVVRAFFTCPKTDYRRNPRPVRWHAKRPDGDNVLKAVKDAAKGVLWLDDSQVCHATIVKLIAAQGDAPRTEVEVWNAADEPFVTAEGQA